MLEPYEEDSKQKFNVGDYVTVKDGLRVGEDYGELTLLKSMNNFGKRMKVLEITRCGNYRCECDGVFFYYSPEMLVPYKNKFTVGDKVIVIDNGKCFPTYYRWVDANVKDAESKVRYNYGHIVNEGMVATVIAIAPRSDWCTDNLVYISDDNAMDDNNCYLIGINGVDKVYEF